MQLQPHGLSISLRRFLSDYFPIAGLAEEETADNRRVRRAQILLARHVLPHVQENMERAAVSLGCSLADTIVPHNSMDSVFFLPSFLPPELPEPAIIISAHKATPPISREMGNNDQRGAAVVLPSWTAISSGQHGPQMSGVRLPGVHRPTYSSKVML